ncbi:MAG: hypothetical protein OXR73_22160 [Myxococcales bacterium]|nr:hypothetical protein [Myxococcales bacterium]
MRAAGSTWYETRTPRFSVITNGQPEQARQLAQDLERFHAVMLKTTTFEAREAAPPLRVFLTRDHAEYVALGGREDSAGMFKSSIRGNFALVTLKRHYCRELTGSHIRCRNETVSSDAARAVLFHEYVHYVESQAGSRTPSWYAEGLAEYMGATQFREDGTYTLGCPREERMGWMRQQDWIPMDKLMTADVIIDIPGHYANTYGQAWAAMHYFSADKARAAKLANYLSLWASGTEHDQAVEQALGVTPEELNGVIHEYALQSHFQCLAAPSAGLDDVPAPSLEELGTAEAHFGIAELLFSTLGPTDAVFDLLAEGHRLAPKEPRLLAALARAHWARAVRTERAGDASSASAPAPTEEDTKKAMAYLTRALRAPAGPGAAAYVAVVEGNILTSRAMSQLAGGDSEAKQTLLRARKAYRRAIKTDEALAEAYVGLGNTYLVADNGSNEPIVVLEAAAYLLPLSAEVPIALAQLRMLRGQYAEAVAPLRYAVAWGAHSGAYEKAKQLLEQALTAGRE